MSKLRRLSAISTDYHQQKSKLVMTDEQYHTKMKDILHKLQIQSKYTTRVSHSNIMHIEELAKVKNQLNDIYEMRKNEELNQVYLHNVNNELKEKLKDTEIQLIHATNELYKSRKEIASLNKELGRLHKAKDHLTASIFISQRDRSLEISIQKDEVDQQLLKSRVMDYLNKTDYSFHPLYQYCLNVTKSENYQCFFENLQKTINKLQNHSDLSKRIQPTKIERLRHRRLETESLSRH